jgi:ABC-type dipeptide/oligopeptide/nickel transport system permease component
MLAYMGRRLVSAIPVLLIISVIVFAIIHLIPGDPVTMIIGDQPVSAEQMEKIRTQLGLDRPLIIQYLDFVGSALRGDLGQSIHSHLPVSEEIVRAFPHTIALTAGSMVFALTVGMTLGVLAARWANTMIDTLSMLIVNIGVSAPTFWTGLILIFVFAYKTALLPMFGASGFRSLILPSVSLGFYAAATIARIARSSMLEVLNEEYVIVARSKGLRESIVIYKHALRNALIPTVTMVGLLVGLFLAGAVITETVFTRPGIGKLLVDAILWRDYPVVQGVLLVTASCYVLANLAVDVSYAFLDPRIRY